MPLPRMIFYGSWASGCGLPILALIVLPFAVGGLIWMGVTSVAVLIIGSIVLCCVILSIIYSVVFVAYATKCAVTKKGPSPTFLKALDPKNAAKIILSIAIIIVCIIILNISGFYGVPLILYIIYLCLSTKD